MSPRFNDNIKKPKLQDTQLGILKIHQKALGPGESAAGVMWYLSLRQHPKT